VARAALEAALTGVELTGYDRRFLTRLSQWDKRNAAAVASLVARARQAGRAEAGPSPVQAEAVLGTVQAEAILGPVPAEAGLSPAQRETVIAALMDAFAYRTSGAAADGCWDCANRPSGLCAEHAKDADRARAFADLAAALSGKMAPTALPCMGAVTEYRQRTPVAS